MASHKKRKVNTARRTTAAPNSARPATTSAARAGTATAPNRSTAARMTATASAARPKTTSQTTAAAPAPSRPKAPGGTGNGVVRRTTVNGAKRRPLSRYAQRRRRRQQVTAAALAIIGVAALGALAYILWPRPAPHHAPAIACTTGVNPHATVTPASSPPPVAGTPTTTSSGVQYIDIVPGCGTPIKAGDTLTVNYTGWLASNGTLFDSSLKSGRTPFQVVNVGNNANLIQGWNAGLIGMKLDGERRLIIPASLAYGASGQPPTIPPNSTLIFDVTVVSIP